MDLKMLQAFFRLGVFIGGCGFIMLFLQPRHSAEFVLSLCSTLVGFALMLGVVIMMRLFRDE
jgi:hypothetical protein